MDQTLYLEPDEEITSIIDKLKQTQGNRINLVVPRQATLLQSVVNLRLLQREAQNLKKEIALITQDKIGRNLAAQVGLTILESVKNPSPVFQPQAPVVQTEEVIELEKPDFQEAEPENLSVHHFQASGVQKWEKKPAPIESRPQKKVISHRPISWFSFRKITIPAIVLLLLFAIVAGVLTLPKTTVKVQVAAEDFAKTTDIEVGSKSNTDQNIYSGTFIDISKDKEEKFTSTGKKNLGSKASGTINIYNSLDSNSHNLAVGAKLSSSSKTFILKSAVSVPGATVQNLKIVPGAVSVMIEAENAGEEYNLEPGRFTIVSLPSNQQEAIYGQSSKALTGGLSKEVQVVSAQDYDQAKTKLTDEVNQALDQELGNQTNGLKIFDNSKKIDQVDLTTSAAVDKEASDFTMKLTERLRIIAVNQKDYDQFNLDLIQKQVPYDKMVTLGDNGEITSVVKELLYEQEKMKVTVTINGKLTSRIDVAKIQTDLKGKNKSAAESYLKGLNGVSSAEINFSPSWWFKRIPRYGRNIKIELDYSATNTQNSTDNSPKGSN